MKKSQKTIKRSKTPRQYLSWSSFSLFLRSREMWKKVYLYGQSFSSIYTEFGKRMAEALESSKDTGEKDLDFARIFIPKYPYKEFEVWKNKKRKQYVEINGIKLFGILDRWNPKKRIIGEVKTGMTKWTQEKVDKDRQLTFYALLIYLLIGHLPERIELYYIPTIEEDGKIRISGKIETFYTIRKFTDIMKMAAEIGKVWKEILKVCEKEYSIIN